MPTWNNIAALPAIFTLKHSTSAEYSDQNNAANLTKEVRLADKLNMLRPGLVL